MSLRIARIKGRIEQATANLKSAESKRFVADAYSEIRELSREFWEQRELMRSLKDDLKRAKWDATEEKRSLLEGFAEELGEMRDKTLRRSGHLFEAQRRDNEEKSE